MNCYYYNIRKQSYMCAILYSPPPACFVPLPVRGPWILDPAVWHLSPPRKQIPPPPHTHTHIVSLCPRWNCHLHCSLVLFLCPEHGSPPHNSCPFIHGSSQPITNPQPPNPQPPWAAGAPTLEPPVDEWGVNEVVSQYDLGCFCYAHSWCLNSG